MADEPIVTPAVIPVATPEPTPAPAVEPAAPTVTPEPTPETVQTPVPAESVAPAETALKPHTDTPTLLEEATKSVEEPKPEAKTEDTPKPDEIKPEPVKPAEVKFEPYKLPEDAVVDDGRISAFNEIVGADLTPQERGQKLIEMYVTERQNIAKEMVQAQHQNFADTRAAWRKEVMGDPELGGSGHHTAMKAIAKARDMFVSREKPGTEGYTKDLSTFNDFLKTTGAGDNPVFLRMMHNVARKFDEPAPIDAPYKPPADIGKAPGSRGRLRDLYKQTAA